MASRRRSLTLVATVLLVGSISFGAASCARNDALSSTPDTSTQRSSPELATPAHGDALIAGVARQSAVPTGCLVTGEGRFWLPDRRCTPGAINPAVTQADIGRTICVPGFSSSIRPPESFTYALKRAQMAAWGISGSTRSIEEDHLIPLSLGGAPSDARNLWPEQGGIPNVKDTLEFTLYRLVCRGEVPLTTAQRAIASNWVAAYQRYVGTLPS